MNHTIHSLNYIIHRMNLNLERVLSTRACVAAHKEERNVESRILQVFHAAKIRKKVVTKKPSPKINAERVNSN